MLADITSLQISAAATLGLLLVGIITLVMKIRHRRNAMSEVTPEIYMYSRGESPRIHSTTGVPTLEQLTQDVHLDPKDRSRARWLYEMGLKQYNHYMNNRDGVVTESIRVMNELRSRMTHAEVSLADEIGVALASKKKGELRKARVQYEKLEPEAQILAQHRRREYEALQTIANDIRHNIPRTDYSSVRSRIESGHVALGTIMSDLPIPWQDLRTISEVDASKPPISKPPKRKFIHVVVLDREEGVCEDKRAERQGNWIHSHKLGMLMPYQEPLPVFETRSSDGALVPTGKKIAVISGDIGPEWATEFWRQGGYLDQHYLLARDGQLPEQIHRMYRRKQLTRGILTAAIILAVLDAVMLTHRFT